MINDFIMGAVAMGFVVAALFFLRFWQESRDRLFGLFALGFLMLACNRLVIVLLHENVENSLVPYLMRLIAFGIILLAVIDKNLRRT